MRKTLFTILMLGAPRAALACPVCFGQNDSAMGNAVKLGVIMMLGVVAAVLFGFASFIVHLNRRARLFAEPSGPPEGGDYARSDPQEGTAQC